MFRHAAELFFLSSAGLLVTTIAFAGLWVRARERATRAEALLEGVRMMAGRTGETHPALDAMAVEIERIGEGQRFLTRVMSEQGVRPNAPSTRGSNITPH